MRTFFFLVVATFVFAKESSLISFDDSMKKANASFATLYESQMQEQWKLVRTFYEKYQNTFSQYKPGRSRIPKKIHQIWLGGALPKKYEVLQKSWIKHHPDWEYKLWTDEDVKTFPFSNRKRFDEAISVGEKSDILRYEILNFHGGLYVDTDFECLAAFDEIHYACDFYVGVLAAFEKEQEVHIGNALIASVPNHPILKYCLKKISKKKPGKTPDEVQGVSGPGILREAFFSRCQKGRYRNVAFPFSFFYPLHCSERRGHLSLEEKKKILHPESVAIHYWDVSWADPHTTYEK